VTLIRALLRPVTPTAINNSEARPSGHRLSLGDARSATLGDSWLKAAARILLTCNPRHVTPDLVRGLPSSARRVLPRRTVATMIRRRFRDFAASREIHACNVGFRLRHALASYF
jgi:hypothetical protein